MMHTIKSHYFLNVINGLVFRMENVIVLSEIDT